jgi:hypothetical protein
VTTYSYDGIIQYDTIAVTGTYDITADGAQGTPSFDYGSVASPGGLGASVSGDIVLQQGAVLEIVVGGQGSAAVSGGGGGGGGSFVIEIKNGSGSTVDINEVIAGGGGGGGFRSDGSGNLGGRTTGTGGNGEGYSAGAGGVNGAPGTGGFTGGGGGGFEGGAGASATRAASGSSNLGNFAGGAASTPPGDRNTAGGGGFGGGGGGGTGGGGGGGGFGGGGGGGSYFDASTSSGGGGGGSFIAAGATDVTKTASTHHGVGVVTIVPAVPCFCSGSMILTPAGEVKVEHLSVGDPIVTLGGIERPIVWIGKGKVLTTRGKRGPATPIVFHKGALADNVPNQDLYVTKGHSFYIDNVLIPAEFLVNDKSIFWDDHALEVEIYHIELATHDVLFANGAPAESYRDDGNRWLFQNANDGWDQPEMAPYAPVLTGGPVVDEIWHRLLERAGGGSAVPTTQDSDLHLLVDGVRLDTIAREAGRCVFRLSACPKRVRIVSRFTVPSELGFARDPRSLGVALRKVILRQGWRMNLIDPDDDRLVDGFHAYEEGDNIRWTNGDAVLPDGVFANLGAGAIVELHLGGATTYPLFGAAEQAIMVDRGAQAA